jgi:undecaprenyl-diphosphatase
MDAITAWGTLIASTMAITACTLLAMVLVWGLTRQWWRAIVPGIAVLLQFVIFISVEALIHRPRPDVPHLDQAPPTSSFPSGHAGAATALWLSLALLAQRIRTTWVRVVVTVICVLVPLAVGYSRLYRGMHSATDVAVGLLNGAVCAVLAHGYLRRDLPAPVGASPRE